MRRKYKILLDTSALLSGLNSSFGASGLIISLFQIRSIEIIISSHIVKEANTVIKKKFPLLKEKFINFLLYRPTIVKKITKIQLQQAFTIIQTEDTPILAAAIKSQADFLITLDKRFEKLVKDKRKLISHQLNIMSPGEFINHYRNTLKRKLIIETPKQAIEDFLKINNPERSRRTKMDDLGMEDYLISKAP